MKSSKTIMPECKPILIGSILSVFLSHAVCGQSLVNLGLVGVGRVPANSFDALGAGVDTLGGIFSGMAVDPRTFSQGGGSYSAELYVVPDCGFGDGANDFHNRIHNFGLTVTPYNGPFPTAAQNQIQLGFHNTMLFTFGESLFTGYNPNDTSVAVWPQSPVSSPGMGNRSLDSEGLVLRTSDDGFYVADEYGPFIYSFDFIGEYEYELHPPAAYIPKSGAAFGSRVVAYGTVPGQVPTQDSGRFYNRGFEGLSLTPDGRKLVAILQAPLQQDGENRDASRNTRILIFDVDPASPTFTRPVAEYIYELTLEGSEARDRNTTVSELLALSDTQFLVLERDNRGRGGEAGPILYKRVVKADVSRATNLLGIPGTPYDLEKGAPGQLSLPASGLPVNVVAATRSDLVDLADRKQLAKFGLNGNAAWDNNTLSEKWEGLAVLPLNDPAAPRDYLLLIGNDNDFKASTVYDNGVIVGSNPITIDSMLLAFRIGEDHIPPTITCPTTLTTVVAGPGCTLPDVTAYVTVSDNSAGPVLVSQNPPSGSLVALNSPVPVTVTAVDFSGNSAPCAFYVQVSGPAITLQCPGTLTSSLGPDCLAAIPNCIPLTTAGGGCGAITLSQSPSAGTVVGSGTYAIAMTATDSTGQSNTCTITFTVTGVPPAITLQCPGALTGSLGPNCLAAIPNCFSLTTVAGGCGTITLSQSPAAGTVVGSGTYAIAMTATDSLGQSNTCTTTFTVSGGGPEITLQCPGALTSGLGSNCLAVIPNVIPDTAVGGGCGSISLSQSPPAGTTVSSGAYAITVTATDSLGQSKTCTTIFTVTGVGPEITMECPDPLTNGLGPNCLAVIPNLIPDTRAAGGCGSLTLSQYPPADTVVGSGTYAIAVTATDSSGQSNTCTTTFTVTGVASQLSVTVTPSRTTLWPRNHKMIPVTLAVAAEGGCSAVQRAEIISVTVTEGIVTVTGATSPDWEITGPLALRLRAESSGSATDRIYTIVVRCTDAAGGVIDASTTVTVPHDQS